LKKLFKKIWPIAVGLGLAAIIIISYIFCFPGSLNPEKAVTGYIKASMKQDINQMMKFSSEYQKTVLFGNRDYTISSLKDRLKKSYDEYDTIYAESEITFILISTVSINSDSNEYKELLSKYEEVTGNKDISGIKEIVLKVFVDGEENRKQTVYAVKSGISWFYGF